MPDLPEALGRRPGSPGLLRPDMPASRLSATPRPHRRQPRTAEGQVATDRHRLRLPGLPGALPGTATLRGLQHLRRPPRPGRPLPGLRQPDHRRGTPRLRVTGAPKPANVTPAHHPVPPTTRRRETEDGSMRSPRRLATSNATLARYRSPHPVRLALIPPKSSTEESWPADLAGRGGGVRSRCRAPAPPGPQAWHGEPRTKLPGAGQRRRRARITHRGERDDGSRSARLILTESPPGHHGTSRLLDLVDTAAKAGVEVEVREFATASGARL